MSWSLTETLDVTVYYSLTTHYWVVLTYSKFIKKIAFATGDMFMNAYEPISLDAVQTENSSCTMKLYFKITKVYIQLHDFVVIFCKILMILWS